MTGGYCEYGANGGRRIYNRVEIAERALQRCKDWAAEGDETRKEQAIYLCPLTNDHWHLSSHDQFDRRQPLDERELEIAVKALQRKWA